MMLVAFGIMGFIMRRYDYPIAPVVVGLILGPMADSALRRSLQMSLGDPMILLQHPGSAVMIAIAVIALLAPFLFKGLARFRQDED
jgi:putative tricarboxylic transport membrane protein